MKETNLIAAQSEVRRVIGFRVSESELGDLDRIAARLGLSRSAVLRSMVMVFDRLNLNLAVDELGREVGDEGAQGRDG